MALDPRIILAGQPLDVVGAMRQGNAAAAETNALRQQNQLTNLYQTQGAGIMAGDQNALNALAGIDPVAALNIQGTRQDMTYKNRQLEVLNAQEARALEEYKLGKDAAALAAEAQAIENAVKVGLALPDAASWDQYMTQNNPDLVGQFGNRQALAQKYMTMADILKQNEPPKPADDYQRYVQEETAAGRQPLDRISYSQAIKGKGFEVVLPDGTRVSQGGSGSSALSPSDPMSMVASIDGILNDPALPYATGWYEWTQNIPGTGSKRFAARANQLKGQAFLQAFESLKGAGQITEIEGTKATEAIGRLDTAQSAEDYAQALTELRQLLILANERKMGISAAPAAGSPEQTGQAGSTTSPPQSVTLPPDLQSIYDAYK